MSVQVDFTLPMPSAGTLQVSLQPPTTISGWSIKFDLMYRFGSPQPIISKYLASGYTGVSGITLVDGVKGIFNVSLYPLEVSGLDPQNLAYQTYRTDSGAQTAINGGFRLAGAPF